MSAEDKDQLANIIVRGILMLMLLYFCHTNAKKIEENTNKIEKLYKIVQTVCPEEVDKIEETKK